VVITRDVCRPSRTTRGYRRSPFDCDSTSGTDVYEAYQPYKPALRSISSLPADASSSKAVVVLPPPQHSIQKCHPSHAAGRQSLSATTLPELQQIESPKRHAKHSEAASPLLQQSSSQGSSRSSQTIAGTLSVASSQSAMQASSSKASEPSSGPMGVPNDNAEHADGRNVPNTGGVSSGAEESAPESDLSSPDRAKPQSESAQDQRRWLWRPWMWVGLKRGIKRRAAQVQC